MSGVSWIAVHGRTMRMKSSEPPLLDHLTQVKQSCRVPVIVNGTISSPSDIGKTYEKTGCDGIMSARAVLGNPAIFKGYEQVPQECLEDFVNISLLTGTSCRLFTNHIMFFLHEFLNAQERRELSAQDSVDGVLDFLISRGLYKEDSLDSRLHTLRVRHWSTKINSLFY